MGNKNVLRRDFLGMLATGAAAIGIGSLASGSVGKAVASTPFQAGNDMGLESWLSRITGKHKQVFDATSVNHGFPLAFARVFLSTNNSVGVPDSDCTAVIVLRHDSIPIGMESRLWEKYKMGENFEVMNPETNAPMTKNPFYMIPKGVLPFDDMTVDELQKRGAMFGICDMALTFNSMKVGKKMGLDPAEVKKDWVAGLLPGIQIVPSGVLAVNRTQEHGCTYCYAG
jgi:intracellular sulfur oxidation DsrE/DsrF family protein